jgi:uracil-DNA glycosylase
MRLQQVREEHVAPLNAFVEALRSEMGADVQIPYFDPWDGGIEAEILFLLEAPGAKAVRTGFVSRNNPDQTAKNFFQLNEEAGIPRKKTITWNAVPWYIGTGSRIRAATRSDLEAGFKPLPRLLDLLPNLRTVVFVGRKAARSRSLIEQVQSGLNLFDCPHPSPLVVNRSPDNRKRILEALKEISTHHAR